MTKPGDHPEFFRLPPPNGASRESTIILKRDGNFTHEGQLIKNAKLAAAFASWLDVHPDDGRYILNNQYDWTYVTVEDTPFFVTGLTDIGNQDTGPLIELSDGSRESLVLSSLQIGGDDALYCRVKDSKFDAKFCPRAQLQLAPLLLDGEQGVEVEVLGVRARPTQRRRQ